jgi:hypothetical protein
LSPGGFGHLFQPSGWFFYLLRLCKISVQHLAHTHLVGVSLMPPSGSLSRLQSSQWVIACLP